MKANLQLRLSQHLALTPQLQQSIRLLQLSTLDLNTELEKFLMENPLLEREEPVEENTAPRTTAISAPETVDTPSGSDEPTEWNPADNWTPDSQAGNWREGDDDGEFGQQASAPITLVDHLSSQLRLMNLNEREHQLVSQLIAQLDDDGYLQLPLDDILATYPESLVVEADELHVSLSLLQSLDPPGIGARNLAECLTLQLLTLPERIPGRDMAVHIARDHLPLLASHDFARLKKAVGADDDALRQASKLITQLNPKPGADFVPIETRYVVPDVVIKKTKGKWTAVLNQDAMPRLRINKLYADLLQSGRDPNGQLSGQLQEARWLIKNVQQRFDTILRVSQAVVDRQHHFFDHGAVAMRPLVLREIADTVGLHESTISRVTTQKYMLTPRGIFELKYFFSSHVSTESGGAASSTAIRALIRQLVDAEDHHKPLSDSRISDILGDQGIVVARRTVAKYREVLQIYPASQRKTL
jgi:RNA polymerase sigma-54 factor